MKNVLATCIILVIIGSYLDVASQVVPPYFTDFESGASGWTDSTLKGSSWQLGTPNYGNTTGALSGVNAWDIELDTNYKDSTVAFLTTPAFDLSTTVNPILSFWLNYNMENVFDGLVLQYSVNGLPWTNLGTFGAGPPYYNWYTNPIIISGLTPWPGWSGNTMGWNHSQVLSLSGTGIAGQSFVQFRFVFTADEQVHFDGVSVDNFSLYDQSADDVGVWQVISPYPVSAQGTSRPVEVIIFNYGTNVQTTFDVSYSLNGGAPATQTWSGNLTQGESDTVIFPNIIVPAGTYLISAYTSLATDMYAVNDTAPAILSGVLPTIAANSNPDTTTYSPCDIPRLFWDQVNGMVTGLIPGDTLWLHAAWGDGTDTLFQTVLSGSNFLIPVTHWYTFPGQFSIQYILTAAGGLAADTLTLINEVLMEDSCGNITGKAYLDTNQNCIYDGGDMQLPYVPLLISTGGNPQWWEITDSNGNYQFDVPPGPAYDVSLSLPPGPYTINCPPTGTYQGITILPSTGNDFAISADPGFDLEPILNVGGLSLLSGGWIQASVRNNLLQPVAGTLCIAVDTSLYTLVSVNPPPTTFSNDTLSWNTGLLSFGAAPYSIGMQLSLKPIVQLGDTICFMAVAKPVAGDSVPANNIKTKCRPVVLAIDPNIKHSDPPGIAYNGLELNYQVDFQNTGTDTAINVFIIDTLDANLDISTLRILSHSHPMTTVFIGPRVIKFTFNNILLPDSGSSEPESHGYVTYAINPASGLQVGTDIENTAHIYFDFHPAVVTNTTVNTVVGSVGFDSGIFVSSSLAIFPNPTPGFFAIKYRLPNAQSSHLAIYNLNMQKVQEMQVPIGSTEIEVDLSGMPDGLYQVILNSGEHRVSKRVMKVK